eukprot:6220186-Pyramimonas_sp.AAC.1
MAPLVKKWQDKKYGVRLGHSAATNMTNLRFADDVVLTCRTLPQLTDMLGDMIQTAKQHGLLLHPDKTKTMSNLTQRAGRGKGPIVNVCGM